MSMKPILFNTEMVKAILEGRKTVTRRLVKNPPNNVYAGKCALGAGLFDEATHMRVVEPPYKVGDILYVRETWTPYCINKKTCANHLLAHSDYCYKAGAETAWQVCVDNLSCKWHPSIHMPKEAARIFLRVTNVRVERLQDITEADALKEGVPDDWPMNAVYCPVCQGKGLVGAFHPGTLGYMDVDCPRCAKATQRFANLWDSTIKTDDLPNFGWVAKPWVWVIEFERCEKPKEDPHG